MQQHPVVDGKVIETAYTREYVEKHFLNKQDVREGYVPKDTLQQRLDAKDRKIAEAVAKADEWKDKVLELQPQVAEAQTLTQRLAEYEQREAARADQDAFRQAGILGEDGNPTIDAELVKFAHKRAIEALPEDQRPEDAAAHFRQWVTAEDGLRAVPAFAPHFSSPAPTPSPAPEQPVPATRPTPTGNTGTVNQPRSPKVTAADRRAYFNSAEFQRLPLDQQKAKLAEMRKADMKQG